jgi:hypothetical protein
MSSFRVQLQIIDQRVADGVKCLSLLKSRRSQLLLLSSNPISLALEGKIDEVLINLVLQFETRQWCLSCEQFFPLDTQCARCHTICSFEVNGSDMRFSNEQPMIYFNSVKFELDALQEIWSYWAALDKILPTFTHFHYFGRLHWPTNIDRFKITWKRVGGLQSCISVDFAGLQSNAFD